MPINHPTLPKAPLPTRINFDPYNSSSTGHQRAENRLSSSTSWRDSRSYKLGHQFRDSTGRGGQSHLSDLVGAGSENFGKDGRKENGDWEAGAPGLRERGWQDIRGLMGGPPKKRKLSTEDSVTVKRRKSDEVGDTMHARGDIQEASSMEDLPFSSAQPQQNLGTPTPTPAQEDTATPPEPPPPQIFRSLTLYLNGSTTPLISDHRLKQLWVQHGGSLSVALGRRTVTHVVIGDTAGGGLAAGKVQKEVRNVRGKGIKFVTAQWVVDCVERGRRVGEGNYAPERVKGTKGWGQPGLWEKSAKRA